MGPTGKNRARDGDDEGGIRRLTEGAPGLIMSSEACAAESSCNFLMAVMTDASVTIEPVHVRARRGLLKIYRSISPKKAAPPPNPGTAAPPPEPQNLQPGDWVEVRPMEEVLTLLDSNRKSQGLLWMSGMDKFCGKRFKVFKRVEIITLETTGESRRLRSPTVFLEGVYCDGSCVGGCDRSCFHFWRESWLKKVPDKGT